MNWFILKGDSEEKTVIYYLKVVRLLFSRSINVSVSRILSRVGAKNVDYLKFTAKHNFAIMITLLAQLYLQLHAMAMIWLWLGR